MPVTPFTHRNGHLRTGPLSNLQQSAQDNGVACRNFFDSINGKRKGTSMGLPRFMKKSHRQSARFTRNARFKFTKMNRTTYWLRLPGIPVSGGSDAPAQSRKTRRACH